MNRPQTVAEVEDPQRTGHQLKLAEWRRRFGVDAGLIGGVNGPHFQVPDPHGPDGTWGALVTMVGAHALVVSRQPHGSSIGVHANLEPGTHLTDGLDGHLTGDAGTYVAVTVADCVPVYLTVVGRPTIGLLHAGWRGVAAGIIESGISMIADLAQVSAQDIVIHCGVAICGGCYEVGREVLEALGAEPSDGPAKLDLRQLIASRALSLGVGRVSISPYCAAHDSHRFVSHRQSRGKPQRMVAYIGRPVD